MNCTRTSGGHDLGVSDVFEGSNISSFTSDRGSIDYEPLPKIDPEILMFYTDKHWTHSDFRDTYLAFLQDHDTASQLTAVQNSNVYTAGGMYQGPLLISRRLSALQSNYSLTNDRVPKLPLNRTNAVDILVVAVEKPAHQLRWFVVSCSPRLRRGEHVELFEKFKGEVLEQR